MPKCECEHVDHFEMPERPTLHTSYMPEVEATLAVKTAWGTFQMCRSCVEAGHGADR